MPPLSLSPRALPPDVCRVHFSLCPHFRQVSPGGLFKIDAANPQWFASYWTSTCFLYTDSFTSRQNVPWTGTKALSLVTAVSIPSFPFMMESLSPVALSPLCHSNTGNHTPVYSRPKFFPNSRQLAWQVTFQINTSCPYEFVLIAPPLKTRSVFSLPRLHCPVNTVVLFLDAV